jgi:predicted flap endonuclease-1-like 5' DNA nuclease
MQWLIANMWMAMAAATVLGLLFGFAFRGILVGGRIRKAEVEREVAKTELSQSKAEVEALYAAQRKQREDMAGAVNNDEALRAEIEDRDRHIVALGEELAASNAQIEQLKLEASNNQNGFVAAGAAAAGAVAGAVLSEDHEAELTQLRDRNAWLEERVGALESDISSMQAAPIAAPEETDEDRVLAEKAAWKASYLATRVEALEQELIDQAQAAPDVQSDEATDQVVQVEAEPAAPNTSDVDEELANLRWRNRYLEGRLAYFEETPDDENGPEEEGTPAEPEPLESEAELEAEQVQEEEVLEDIVSDTEEPTPSEPEESKDEAAIQAAETEDETEADDTDAPTETSDVAVETEPEVHPSDAILAQLDGVQPVQLDRPKDGGDDLTKITGIGPRIAEVLNGLSIWTFAQIAEWEPENETWVENHLSFKGRVSREKWVEQAKDLLVEA